MSGFSQSAAGTTNISGTFSPNVSVTNFPAIQNVNVVSGTMTLVQSGSFAVSSTTLASEATQLLGIPQASQLSKCFRFLVTGSQSTQLSFLTAPQAQLVAAISASKIFTFASDPSTPVYFAFSTGSTGESIDSTDVFGAKQCDCIFASERRDFQIPVGISSLIVSASITGSVSLSVSS